MTSPSTPAGSTLAPTPGSASGVTVHVVEHPRGALMRIGHEGGSIVLDRDEAIELYQLMQAHLGTMPLPRGGAERTPNAK